MSEYAGLAKKWVEVTKRVAAGTWDGIVCPKNADADVLIEVREQGSGTDDARFEHWIHCRDAVLRSTSTARIITARFRIQPVETRHV